VPGLMTYGRAELTRRSIKNMSSAAAKMHSPRVCKEITRRAARVRNTLHSVTSIRRAEGARKAILQGIAISLYITVARVFGVYRKEPGG
jgi:hypothetical protein